MTDQIRGSLKLKRVEAKKRVKNVADKPVKPASEPAAQVPTFGAQQLAAIERWPIADEAKAVLKAYIGHQGQSLRLLCSDKPLRQRLIAGAVAALTRMSPISNANTKVFMMDTLDNGAATSVRHPIIRAKAMGDKVRKAMAGCKLDGIVFAHVHMVEGLPILENRPGCLTTCRALVFAPEGTDAAVLQRQLMTAGKFKNGLSVPEVQLTLGSLTDVDALAGWLFELPNRALQFDDAQGRFVTSPRYTKPMRLRLLEILSQMELPDCLSAVGACAPMTRALKSSLSKWQQGKLQVGHILPVDHNAWEFWITLRRQHGPRSCLPVRFDYVAPTDRTAPALKPPVRHLTSHGRARLAAAGKRKRSRR